MKIYANREPISTQLRLDNSIVLHFAAPIKLFMSSGSVLIAFLSLVYRTVQADGRDFG